MQFATAILVATAAIGVSATPASWNNPPPGGNSGSSASCPSNGAQYCCNGGLVGLDCLLPQILGTACTQQSICCVNNGNGKQSCTNNNGNDVNVPININL